MVKAIQFDVGTLKTCERETLCVKHTYMQSMPTLGDLEHAPRII